MASLRSYTWRSFDSVWHVAGRLLSQAGYTDVPTFVRAIQISNSTILDWAHVPVGSIIVIPYATT